MAITIPKKDEIEASILASIHKAFSDLEDPIRVSWHQAFADSFALVDREIYRTLELSAKQVFPQTSSGYFLENQARLSGIIRYPETQSTGLITAVGTIGGSIPINTNLVAPNGNSYITIEDKTIIDYIANGDWERQGSTVFVTFAFTHSFASGIEVTITDCEQTEINGIYIVASLADNKISFDIDPSTPTDFLSGNLNVNADLASIRVLSVAFGADQNIQSGNLEFSPSLEPDVSAIAYIQITGIAGGSDKESEESLRERTMIARSSLNGNWTASHIKEVTLSIAGVTRVWVQEPTCNSTESPYRGQVRIAFMRDNDSNPFPSQEAINQVKEELCTEIKPADRCCSDVLVVSPTPLSIDFIFSALYPNTSGIRLAIESNLQQFFDEQVSIGFDQGIIYEDSYRCAIQSAIDLSTGTGVTNFELTSPIGDIIVDTLELPVLGNITFGV